MPEKSYAEQVAEYRAHRHEREALERRVEIEREFSELVAQRDASQDGDTETFDFYDRQLEELEAEHSRLVPAPPPVPTYTDAELDVMRRHSPAEYGRPHWTQQSKYNDQKLSNEQIVGSIAGYAQSRFVQERAQRGLQTTPQDLEAYRNSADYKAALEVGEPVEQGGVSSPDEFIEEYNKTAKHKLNGKIYNQGAKKLIAGKARGDYPDR